MAETKLDVEKPKTVTEAVEFLISKLSPTAKDYIRTLGTEQDLYQFHFNLGMGIRNNFGLWEDNEALLEDCGYTDMSREQRHEAADGASHVILVALWKALKEDV